MSAERGRRPSKGKEGGGRKGDFRRKRVCRFCVDKIDYIDFASSCETARVELG